MSIDSSLVEAVSKQVRLENVPFTFLSVSTDTRKQVEQSLFVPLKGERFNGHQFLDQAIAAGAIAAFWDEGESLPDQLPDSFQVYFVEDTLVALQQLAKTYRNQVNPFIIGITGSNGKTTTKDMICELLGGEELVHKTLGNLNNHIGVPLTLLAMPKDCKYAVIEMGMNHAGEIALLSEIAQPNAAVVTNIGEAHIEHLGSREGIAAAKMEIATGLKQQKWLIVDGDERLLSDYEDWNPVKIGFSDDVDVPLTEIQSVGSGYTFSLGSEKGWRIHLLGKHNVKNIAYAIWIARKLGISQTIIQERINKIKISGMRLEQVSGPNGSTFINDAYNANPTSMKAAIKTIKELPGYQERVLVLGDIYELGPDEEFLHKSVAEVIDRPITVVITVGEKGRWIYIALEEKECDCLRTYHATSVEEAARHLNQYLKQDTVVLLKASRRLALEHVLPAVKGGHQ